MRELLLDIFYEQAYKTGDVYVVKVKDFYEKTQFLLTGRLKNLQDNPEKSRPIVIINSSSETAEFIALSKNLLYRKIRPKFPISQCEIKEKNCFGINLKSSKNNLIFGKKTATKKLRMVFEVNMHILKSLEKEACILYCGKCSEDVINETKLLIEKFLSEDT